MNYLTMSLIAPVFLLLEAGYLHIHNLKNIHKRIEALKRGAVSKEEFFREASVAQGSNFTGLAMAAWMMLFVAIAYLYFLIPADLPFSYMMQMSEWSSSPIGFLIFGIVVAGLAVIAIYISDSLPEKRRDLKLTELYSFYAISKSMKRNIGLTIPLLAISIGLSAWSGTIYPGHSLLLEVSSFVLIILSLIILIWPIWEGRK